MPTKAATRTTRADLRPASFSQTVRFASEFEIIHSDKPILVHEIKEKPESVCLILNRGTLDGLQNALIHGTTVHILDAGHDWFWMEGDDSQPSRVKVFLPIGSSGFEVLFCKSVRTREITRKAKNAGKQTAKR